MVEVCLCFNGDVGMGPCRGRGVVPAEGELLRVLLQHAAVVDAQVVQEVEPRVERYVEDQPHAHPAGHELPRILTSGESLLIMSQLLLARAQGPSGAQHSLVRAGHDRRPPRASPV
eukprot:CAMPEP_0173192846 /NCGR_PEP_ID=MMETSP1141-20130122/13639_1 /TAXON_ID=483371 /ORGANISM="non described non described, Strain CCMP2298" /LENGTH=115 /DNA_ID=CAMNT_0014117135 /DNA_START=655 /DNA_END=999 /DNA_ORIENTATION=+